MGVIGVFNCLLLIVPPMQVDEDADGTCYGNAIARVSISSNLDADTMNLHCTKHDWQRCVVGVAHWLLADGTIVARLTGAHRSCHQRSCHLLHHCSAIS